MKTRFRLSFGEVGGPHFPWKTAGRKQAIFGSQKSKIFFWTTLGGRSVESKHAAEGLEDYIPVEIEGQPERNHILLRDSP